MSDAIALVPWDAGWPIAFEIARAELAEVFEPTPLLIEHMGSTAVPGLAAKPVIDIIVLVAEMAPVLERLGRISALGYEYRPDVSNPERLFFRRLGPDGVRSHHLHIHSDAIDVSRYLLLRDLLRADPQLRADYAALKAELAGRHRDDREAYARAKNHFIDTTIAGAGGPPRKPFWNI